ncbi:MAG: hypothetical protein HOP36_02925 [Methyloglobulus sp.]|nr:hypothetical protein [Methyloglobulus sp.]
MFLSYKKICVVIALTISSTGMALAKDSEKNHDDSKDHESSAQYIYTPTLQKDASEVFTCRVVNIGKNDQYFDIAILSSEGKPLETQAGAKLPSGFTSSDSAKTKNTIGYCRVGVKGSPKDLLVSLCSQSATSSSCNAVVTGQFNSTQ